MLAIFHAARGIASKLAPTKKMSTQQCRLQTALHTEIDPQLGGQGKGQKQGVQQDAEG